MEFADSIVPFLANRKAAKLVVDEKLPPRISC